MRLLNTVGDIHLLLLLLLQQACQAVAFFILPCARPVVVQRADPIVNPGALSGHVHTVMGGSGFNFTMDYDAAVASSCSTCKVKQDLSNYWIPNLYYHREDGRFESVKQNGGMLVYYLQRYDTGDAEYENGLVAFPEGFQMLAGDTRLRSFDNTLEQRAISYACLGREGPETHEIPDGNCPWGLRAQVVFPSCWDGENLDSPDHKSHVAYPSLVDNGACPATHPKRFVTLFYEVAFEVQEYADRWYGDNHPFVLSNGDPTGYGLHGDFVNGWHVDVLQEAIDDCTDGGGRIEQCRVFDFFDDQVMNGCRVPVQVDEVISGTIDALPGCNSVQTGPEDASQETGCGSPTDISASQWGFKDAIQSHGFSYLGCASDGGASGRLLSGVDTASDEMTVGTCLDFCEERGLRYAGLQYARECFCGDSIDGARLPVKGILGQCEMACVGDEDAVCGGYGTLSLYKKCEAGESCQNAELM